MMQARPQSTPRKKLLDDMSIRELKAQAAKFTGTTRPIPNYSKLRQIEPYWELMDRWQAPPVDVQGVRCE